MATAEETSGSELRDLMDLHFFGPAALTRSVLPPDPPLRLALGNDAVDAIAESLDGAKAERAGVGAGGPVRGIRLTPGQQQQRPRGDGLCVGDVAVADHPFQLRAGEPLAAHVLLLVLAVVLTFGNARR